MMREGPVTGTGWIGKRSLGAWNILPGVSQAFLCRSDAGPITRKERLPGGQEQTMELVLDKPGVMRAVTK